MKTLDTFLILYLMAFTVSCSTVTVKYDYDTKADYYDKFEEAGFVLEKAAEKTGWCNWIVIMATKPAGLPDGAPQSGLPDGAPQACG